MKNHALRILLLLLTGMVLNIVVAEACRYQARHEYNVAIQTAPQPTAAVGPHGSYGISSWLFIEFAQFGLPHPTVQGVDGFRALWPGFLINTLFYALLLWLIFLAPFAGRRMLRRRRGQCAKCAYPIGASPICTECGATILRPRRAEA